MIVEMEKPGYLNKQRCPECDAMRDANAAHFCDRHEAQLAEQAAEETAAERFAAAVNSRTVEENARLLGVPVEELLAAAGPSDGKTMADFKSQELARREGVERMRGPEGDPDMEAEAKPMRPTLLDRLRAARPVTLLQAVDVSVRAGMTHAAYDPLVARFAAVAEAQDALALAVKAVDAAVKLGGGDTLREIVSDQTDRMREPLGLFGTTDFAAMLVRAENAEQERDVALEDWQKLYQRAETPFGTCTRCGTREHSAREVPTCVEGFQRSYVSTFEIAAKTQRDLDAANVRLEQCEALLMQWGALGESPEAAKAERADAWARLAAQQILGLGGAPVAGLTLNTSIKVKLTEETAAKIYAARVARGMPADIAGVPADGEGWSRWELWRFARDVGPLIRMSAPLECDMEIRLA